MSNLLKCLFLFLFLNEIIPLLYQWQLVQRSSNPQVREIYAALPIGKKLTFGAVREKLPAFRGLFVLMRISMLIGVVCAAVLLVLFFSASEGAFLLYTRRLCLVSVLTAAIVHVVYLALRSKYRN